MLKTYRLADLDQDRVMRLCRRNRLLDEDAWGFCREVFSSVRERGDEAVREYTQRYDGVRVPVFQVPPRELELATRQLSDESLKALWRAARNIEFFHATQLQPEPRVEVEEGVACWRERRPIETVGLYVPGGNAILASTALMLGIPARLAGCRRIAMFTPPRRNGSVASETLAAAWIAGIREVYAIGGAQAIAAMAIGTESVPKVDKIFGPGSRVVQAAKLMATLHGTAIDMAAGPSEVLVVADDSASPSWVASDLLAQAEHGPDSFVALATTSSDLAGQVCAEIEGKLQRLPRRELAAAALQNSFAAIAGSLDEAMEFSNVFAPEHLMLHVREPRLWAASVTSAGSVFLGPWSPEVAGDYASGTNHTLPTSGAARAVSGLSVDDFVKKIAFQELGQKGLSNLAPTLVSLARLEGLEGHARSVLDRLSELEGVKSPNQRLESRKPL